MLSASSRRSIAGLQALALSKGYEVQRSTLKGCWWLVRGKERAVKADRSAAWTVKEAEAFLRGLEDHHG